MQATGKTIIISAPSGSGKSTIISHLLKVFPRLEFSISATSRDPRPGERNGVEYYFVTPAEFALMAADRKFIEWEEVYAGTSYGTLESEIERIWKKDNVIIFDVDVQGGISLKKIFGDKALSVFIMPPSVEELRRRLEKRDTDSAEVIAKRVAKAEEEIGYAENFDSVIVNDELIGALREAERLIGDFIS